VSLQCDLSIAAPEHHGVCWGDVELRVTSPWGDNLNLCRGHKGQECPSCHGTRQTHRWNPQTRSTDTSPCPDCETGIVGQYQDPLMGDYGFEQAFEVAARDDKGNANRAIGSTCSNAPFTPADVKFTINYVEGKNDEAHWLWVGLLIDGRWAFVDAGCDYTGWG